MPENSAEMFDRVRLMARIDTDWDLSDNDTAALRHVLAAAEAREGGENAAEISADRAWIDGAKFGWNCETKTDLHEAIANRKLQIREAVVKCPRCDSPDPSLHPAMQLEGEVQPCGDLWHTPATEVIHGDSLSTTVEKLREACHGVRVEPEPEKLPAADEVRKALEKAHWIGCSPHEWPTVDDIPLLCHALIAEHSRASTAAEVIEAAETALRKLTNEIGNIEVLGEYEALDINTGSRKKMRARIDGVEVECREAITLCARWKGANGGK